ncbi:hypothetical protein G6F31_020458 [Rhizopus arrhizus]|nr:hypothetical protein G6F31_020458 [Rhizopus arrhizus]
MRLDFGTTAMYCRYHKDLGGYSLGQGGYYSPQRYASLSLPVSFAWRNDNWSPLPGPGTDRTRDRAAGTAVRPADTGSGGPVHRRQQEHRHRLPPVRCGGAPAG